MLPPSWHCPNLVASLNDMKKDKDNFWEVNEKGFTFFAIRRFSGKEKSLC
jgi:hypothetical protein